MLNMKSKIFKYIYAMLCLLPAIAVGVTCLYVANNQNAFESYSGQENTYVFEDITDNSQIETGLHYRFDSSKGVYTNSSTLNTGYMGISNVENVVTSQQSGLTYLPTCSYIRVYYSTDVCAIYYYDSELTELGAGNYTFISVAFDFVLLSYENSLFNNYTFMDLFTIEQFNYMDNVFYYSLDKVENSSVFSWVKSNFLYDGMNSFVGIFGGTNSNISFYLTWVLTISLCYLGFEVLMLFINMARNLIHAFQTKEW